MLPCARSTKRPVVAAPSSRLPHRWPWPLRRMGFDSLTHKAASLFLLRFPAGATLYPEQVAIVTGTAAAGGIAAR